jgi:hypothetical protein
MRFRSSSCLALVWVAVSCGKSTDIGDGIDASGAAAGKAGAIEPGQSGGVDGQGGGKIEGGVAGSAGNGGRAMVMGGTPTDAGKGGASPSPDSGGGGSTGGLFAEFFGGAGGKGARVCSLPSDFELVDTEELDSSSWVSDDECDAAAEDVRKTIETDGGATLEVKPLAGTWTDGSGDQRIELVLDETGAGTLTFGEPAELPEFDPEEAYLTDIDARDGAEVEIVGYSPVVVPGFAYSVVAETGRASEMAFRIRDSEPWRDWCAAQEPVRGPGCYGCELRGNMIFYGGDECGERAGCYVAQSSQPDKLVNVHCGRLQLCGSGQPTCWCDEGGCTNHPSGTRGYKVTIDPVDVTVLRFNEEYATEGTRYLVREE